MNADHIPHQLLELDGLLSRHVRVHKSLRPGGGIPDEFFVLGQLASFLEKPLSFKSVMLTSLRSIVEAQILHFPDNIYWDYSYLFRVLSDYRDLSSLKLTCSLICQLMALYGAYSPIRFRFIHDFSYGFDWAKWVRRNPEARLKIQPYDLVFLEYLKFRGGELSRMITAKDKNFPPLTDLAWRNPFSFPRDEASERYILETLSEKNQIPLPGWAFNPVLEWRPDYTFLREQIMAEKNKQHRMGSN